MKEQSGYAPPRTWKDRRIVTFPPPFRGKVFGDLLPSELERLREYVERKRPTLVESDYSGEVWEAIEKDLWAFDHAVTERQRETEQVQKRILNPPPAPSLRAAGPKDDDDALRLSLEQESPFDEPRDNEPETAVVDVPQNVPSGALEPVSISQAIEVLIKLGATALREDMTLQELLRNTALTAKLVDLIRENLGKAEASDELILYSMDVWLTYVDRVRNIVKEAKAKDLIAKVGRRRATGMSPDKPTLEDMGISKRLATYLRKLEKVGLDTAKAELRKLDRPTKEGLFKKLGQTKEKGSARSHKNARNIASNNSPPSPMRFIISFLADFRQSHTWYMGNDLNGIAKFANDPLVIENLSPVAEKFAEFAVALAEAVQRAAANEN